MSIQEQSEIYFFQGLTAAQAGLSKETCPYPLVHDHQSATIEQITAPVNWTQGWNFGRFLAVQRGRKEKHAEMQAAIDRLFQHEAEWTTENAIVNQGLFKGGLRYIKARRAAIELHRKIRESSDFRLLDGLQIELYLPFRPTEAPYLFQLHDRQMRLFGFSDEEKTMRGLLARYGDRHGVGEAWREYIRGEPIGAMIPGRAGNAIAP